MKASTLFGAAVAAGALTLGLTPSAYAADHADGQKPTLRVALDEPYANPVRYRLTVGGRETVSPLAPVTGGPTTCPSTATSAS